MDVLYFTLTAVVNVLFVMAYNCYMNGASEYNDIQYMLSHQVKYSD